MISEFGKNSKVEDTYQEEFINKQTKNSFFIDHFSKNL